MFQRLRNYFLKRKCARARGLFEYFDGQTMRRVDPLQVHIELQMHESFTEDDLQLLSEGNAEATNTCIRTVCDVFGVKQWSPEKGTGLTGMECLAILEGYMTYCEGVKKNSVLGLTSPPPTAQESSAVAPEESPAIMN